ncbi:hypothetical protein ACROYT_G001194 [Oculina patagonica]
MEIQIRAKESALAFVFIASLPFDEQFSERYKCSDPFQKKQFLLLIEDDIYFIHTCHHPTTATTSTAWHMCTGLLDVQEKIPAVSLPPDINKLHPTVPVTMKNGVVKQCRRGIDVKSILEKFSSTLHDYFVSSYLSTL